MYPHITASAVHIDALGGRRSVGKLKVRHPRLIARRIKIGRAERLVADEDIIWRQAIATAVSAIPDENELDIFHTAKIYFPPSIGIQFRMGYTGIAPIAVRVAVFGQSRFEETAIDARLGGHCSRQDGVVYKAIITLSNGRVLVECVQGLRSIGRPFGQEADRPQVAITHACISHDPNIEYLCSEARIHTRTCFTNSTEVVSQVVQVDREVTALSGFIVDGHGHRLDRLDRRRSDRGKDHILSGTPTRVAHHRGFCVNLIQGLIDVGPINREQTQGP